MNRNHAIALLDSGVGGLTVVQEIFRHLPQERIVYSVIPPDAACTAAACGSPCFCQTDHPFSCHTGC